MVTKPEYEQRVVTRIPLRTATVMYCGLVIGSMYHTSSILQPVDNALVGMGVYAVRAASTPIGLTPPSKNYPAYPRRGF